MGTAVRCWVRPLGRGDDTEVLKVRRGLTGGGGRLGGGDNDEIEDEEPCAPSTFILFAGYEKDTYLMYHNTCVACELHKLTRNGSFLASLKGEPSACRVSSIR